MLIPFISPENPNIRPRPQGFPPKAPRGTGPFRRLARRAKHGVRGCFWCGQDGLGLAEKTWGKNLWKIHASHIVEREENGKI